jgi:hypothetical protein
MGRVDEAGFYFRKARKHYETTLSGEPAGGSKALTGDKLLEIKSRIEGSSEAPKFEFPFETPKGIESWD